MDKLEMLLKEKREALATIDTLSKDESGESREFTDDEQTKYDTLLTQVDQLNVSIEKEQRLRKEKQDLAHAEELKAAQDKTPLNPIVPGVVTVTPAAGPDEFKNIGDFMRSVRFYQGDARLKGQAIELPQDDEEARLHSMGTGTGLGFLIPKQFLDTILQVAPDVAAFRPRARVMPAGTPPDAELTIPALDQTASQNMYGGVQVDWIAEGVAKPETNARILEIKLTPKEAAGHVVVTDKLLRNSAAASPLLTGLLRGAMTGAEEFAFYSGNGVGRPLGVLNSPARILYPRAAANQIAYADVIGMYARMLRRGGNPVWLYNQTALPQLMSMTDPGSGGTVIWQRSAREGEPATLLGIPAVTNERIVALGTTGDLCLLDLSMYLIKDGSGPFVSASEHVHFLNNKTVIKIFWNVDGQGWLSEPIPLEGSTSNTVSPFVILD